MDSEPASTPSFEESLSRLDDIARALEDNRLGLSQSLTLYEEGVGLLRSCRGLLEQAERKIELLTGVDADGDPVVKPFDDAATFGHQDALSADAGLTKKRKRPPTKAPEAKAAEPKSTEQKSVESPSSGGAGSQIAPWEDESPRLF